MSESWSDQVERAATSAPKLWLLTIVDVPLALGGLLRRHGFRPTKKNPSIWWRRFNPFDGDDRAAAEFARQQLRDAGLSGKWRQVSLGPVVLNKSYSSFGPRTSASQGFTARCKNSRSSRRALARRG